MRNNLQNQVTLSYQSPELTVWSVETEQGFAQSDFDQLTDNDGWGYNDK